MPKDPEDHPGDSHPDGDTPEENSPRPDDSPESSDSSEDQGELPFGGDSKDSASDSNFPEAEFPKSDLGKKEGEDSEPSEPEPEPDASESEEKEPEGETRDDQAEDPATLEESSEAESGDDPHIAGELGPDHEDPYHDEYHHDHDDYHHEHHEEHEYQYDHDYHGHEDDHGDYGYGHGAGYGDDELDSEEEGEEEGFGGPIKPFLDHLEDLRWTVMKVVVAIVVGMLIALIGSPYIVKFLTYPLNSAQQIQQVNSNPDKRMIPIKLGDGVAFHVRESDLKEWVEEGLLVKDANQTEVITALRLIPSPGSLDDNGTKYSMQLHVDTNGTDRVPWEVELKAYGPLKSFFIALKIGLYGGLTLSMPFVIYFLAQFVLPALRINEKQWLFKLSGFGAGLFMLGVVFCYLIIMKVALWASVGFANMLGFGADEWQAEEYISFVCKFMVGMGLAFQMPVILLFLVRVGILDYKKLSDFRMYAVVANLIIAAVITPTGDPFTLSLVAVPLQLLYELSTLIAWFWHKKEAAEKEDEE
ncbi:MAG: twin-arginine translocase subunit TatC [Pedosphaera sp.]|nr:twin-arginine translocase subunit TatC [Pedosphaera sp.]